MLSLSFAACGDTKQVASTEAETVQAQDGEKGLKEQFEESKKTDKKEKTDQEDEEQETIPLHSTEQCLHFRHLTALLRRRDGRLIGTFSAKARNITY